MSGKATGVSARKPPKLPFRLKVPERNELIAYALMTLAMGLMVGLAIGPIVNGAATAVQVIMPSTAGTEDGSGGTEIAASLPALASPAGSDSGSGRTDAVTTLASAPSPDVIEEPLTELPAEEGYRDPAPGGQNPGGNKPDPKPDDPEPEPETKGVVLAGTVLANSPDTKTYWLESGGDLITVFAGTVPDPGLLISTRVLPLANGTLTESGQRSAVDIAKEAKIRSVVSYVDQIAGVIVLSGRGASLPVSAVDGHVLDGYGVGDRVEASLTLNVPDPKNFNDAGPTDVQEELPIRLASLQRLSGNATVELAGNLVAVDSTQRTLTLTADSTGLLGSVVELIAPEDLALEKLTTGRRYSATASKTDEGLRIVGLSPGFGKAAANDPNRAFGTHAR